MGESDPSEIDDPHQAYMDAPDFLERKVYTCGPAPYMAAVRALLAAGGYPMANYHEESFAFESLSTEAEAGHDAGDTGQKASFNVSFSRSGDNVACAVDQTILAAARAAGMRMPSSCTQGLCGTCKTKMVSGQVDMHHAGGIRQREIDQGFILPCCSKPLSDIVLER